MRPSSSVGQGSSLPENAEGEYLAISLCPEVQAHLGYAAGR